MGSPQIAWIGGDRLHLQHGPIDLIISADASPAGLRLAYRAAISRFEDILTELVSELPLLKRRSAIGSQRPRGIAARRMHDAVSAHCSKVFVTPMAAVAGAVADEILAAMTNAFDLERAYVNNGGDIAVHLARSASYKIGIASLTNLGIGRVSLNHDSRIGGIATSGRGGRSLTLGIADSVTVLAGNAAQADVAATLIANSVDIPDHPAIKRIPACQLEDDSDLGQRLVVTDCGNITDCEVREALERGEETARNMARENKIVSAAMYLRGAYRTVGAPCKQLSQQEVQDR